MNMTVKMDNILRKCLNLNDSEAVSDSWEPGNPEAWDSLVNVQLLASIENELNVLIEFEDLIELTNWGQFKKIVEKKTELSSMNEVIKCIFERRSVRSFSTRDIDDSSLKLILKAAVSAPSGNNRQTWCFTVIKNKTMIQRLEVITRKILEEKGQKLSGYFSPSVVILASNDRNNHNGLADCSCALQNMFLAAASLGIGSCWINGLKYICDEHEVRTLLTEFEVPDSHIVWGAASLGYANTELVKPIKKFNVIKYIE